MLFSRWEIFSSSFSCSFSSKMRFSFRNQRGRFFPPVPSCLCTSSTQTHSYHQVTGPWMEQLLLKSSVSNFSLQFGPAGPRCLFPRNDHISHLGDPLSFHASLMLKALRSWGCKGKLQNHTQTHSLTTFCWNVFTTYSLFLTTLIKTTSELLYIPLLWLS